MLHLRGGFFGGLSSEADGTSFFLSPVGHDDPEAELRATVTAFYAPEAKAPFAPNAKAPFAPNATADEHAICKFPARLIFLSAKLGLDLGALPRVTCSKFEEFWKRAEPHSISLIFSSYYLNNPASAFGHTFLRLNKDRRVKGKPAELLDYGVDFSATVGDDNALIYAMKGLTGLYAGQFKLVPFFYKVREYNDYESRDLWDYELELTRSQMTLLVAHLWELGSTSFDYYYMTENCSYHILGALEVANPDLELIEHLGWPVLPADTLKVLRKNPGLTRGVRYRPSLRSTLDARLKTLDGSDLDLIDELVSHPKVGLSAALPTETRVRVLDAAIDLVEARHAKDLMVGGRDLPAHALKQQILEHRAALKLASAPLDTPVPDSRPDLGHDSVRLGIAAGLADLQGGRQLSASFRLALHELADPARGYPESAAIEFLPGRVRWAVDEARLSLEDLGFVRILSLTPMRRYNRQVSWRVSAGALTLHEHAGKQPIVASGEVGGGVTLATSGNFLTAFLLGDFAVQGPQLESGDWPARLGVGPSGGLRLRFHPDLVWMTGGQSLYFPLQPSTLSWRAISTLRWQFASGVALDLAGRLHPALTELELGVMVYL